MGEYPPTPASRQPTSPYRARVGRLGRVAFPHPEYSLTVPTWGWVRTGGDDCSQICRQLPSGLCSETSIGGDTVIMSCSDAGVYTSPMYTRWTRDSPLCDHSRHSGLCQWASGEVHHCRWTCPPLPPHARMVAKTKCSPANPWHPPCPWYGDRSRADGLVLVDGCRGLIVVESDVVGRRLSANVSSLRRSGPTFLPGIQRPP